MNHAKNFAAATLLVLALSIGCYAGDQHTPGYVDPPPPPSSITVCSSTDETTVSTDSTTTDADILSDSLWLDVVTALLSVY